MSTRSRLAALAWGIALVTGLAGPGAEMAIAQPAIAQSSDIQEAEPALPLLVPYRGLMAGIIDWASYGIFTLAAQDAPLSEADWTSAGFAAVNIVATSSLLTMRNSNEDDHRRLADPAWLGMAADLQNASLFVAMAVDARSRVELRRTADMLARTCQSCHDRFRSLPPKDTSRFVKR